jgi:hypothetical protein
MRTKQKGKAPRASGAKRGSRSQAASAERPRPKMVRVSNEMKEWCSMLGHELSSWPDVSVRPMFGLQAYYRKAKIFAGLPVTRAIGGANSVIFKLGKPSGEQSTRMGQDLRVSTGKSMRSVSWYAFELTSEDEIRSMLWWLGQAYENAK